MGLASDLIDRWAPILVGITLKTSDKGRFTVTCDGSVVFDKAAAGRHAEPGEVVGLLEPFIGPRLDWR